MFACQHCQSTFVTQRNLVSHQKQAKYCLEKQGISASAETLCAFCNTQFSTIYRLRHHLESCVQKKRVEEKMVEEKDRNHVVEMYELKLRMQEKEISNLKEQYERENSNLKEQYERELSILRDQLEKRIDDITDIARQTKISYEDDNEDVEEDPIVPLTVSEQLDSMEVGSSTDYMMTLSKLTLNNVTIISRHPDHYVNATQLCQAGGKKFSHWFGLESTKDLITVLSSDAGIPASLLVESKRGATSLFQQGSWIHPDLAIQLAQWISPAFAIQVSRWIRSLFNDGKVAVDLSLMKEQQQRIDKLETVCLSKRKREKYEGQFFIYLLTTDDHLKRRTYIVGKAKNLEHRLGTYNKTCDHTVAYYRQCGSEDNMNVQHP